MTLHSARRHLIQPSGETRVQACIVAIDSELRPVNNDVGTALFVDARIDNPLTCPVI